MRDPKGDPVQDNTLLVLCNAHHEPMQFVLPGGDDISWELILSTELEGGFVEQPVCTRAGTEVRLLDRSLSLLKLTGGVWKP